VVQNRINGCGLLDLASQRRRCRGLATDASLPDRDGARHGASLPVSLAGERGHDAADLRGKGGVQGQDHLVAFGVDDEKGGALVDQGC
jgi:hypothetical protein